MAFGVVIFGLVALSGSMAAASPRDGIGARETIPAAAGIVASTPTGSTFTVTTHGGKTITIDVSPSSTTYLERGISSPTLSNVAVGDLVAVFGTISGTTVSASEVAIVPASSKKRPVPMAAGVVASTPTGSTFTVTTHGGKTITIDVSTSSTTYLERGISSPTLSNVAVGDLVAVFGTISGTTVSASEVLIHTNFRHGFATAGSVQTAPNSNSFTIKTWSGSLITVDVSSSTKYSERGVTNPTVMNVSVGEFVGVFGSTGSTTVTAAQIVIVRLPTSVGSFATAGTVQTKPAGNSFVIETWNHTQMTVDVTSSTTYSERGVTSPLLTSVAIGESVGVFGTTSGTAVTATQVVIGGREHLGRSGAFGHRHHGGHRRGFGRGY